jgi:hypothetical protein
VAQPGQFVQMLADPSQHLVRRPMSVPTKRTAGEASW